MVLKERIFGSRVYLRSLETGDASEAYAGWLNDPEVNKFLETKSATQSSVLHFIEQKNLQPDALFFGIFVNETDLHIGTIKLDQIDSNRGSATLAIMVGDKQYWGQGYGAEAMKILIDFAHKNFDIDKFELGVVAENFTAINAYVKLGFQEIRREKDTVRYGSDVYDHITMCLNLN
jgi:RimJ/RimL family protein N-acetyltransferase